MSPPREVSARALYELSVDALTTIGASSEARALDRALTVASTRAVVGLAALVRDPTRQGELRWPVLSPERLATLDVFDLEDRARLCVATLDRDGYVRDAALRALGATLDADAVARRFAWMRLDDPVWAISSVAERAAAVFVARGAVDALVADLALFDQLSSRARGRRSAAVRAALGLLSGGDSRAREGLRAGMRADDPDVRVACARRLIGDADAAVRVASILTALSDASPATALWAAKEASRKSAPSTAAALAPRMCEHAQPSVRMRGVRLAAKIPDGERLLLPATLDPDAGVRFEARSALVRIGASEYRDLALDALRALSEGSDGPEERCLGALGAMFDVGARDDHPLAARFLRHPRARVRAEALRALGSLAPELYADIFLAALRDSNRDIAREGLRALERCAQSVSPEAFRSLVSFEALDGVARDPEARRTVREGIARLTGAPRAPRARYARS